MNEVPLVSIVCITYNHESFIRDCLDGFFKQKINFPIEILIHDDASTDRTVDIIKEYEEKYPNVIKAIYQTENQYSKGINPNRYYNFPRAKGKYIALCEGDDYWTDPTKLQEQFDIMESNPTYSLCFHDAWIVDNKGFKISTFSRYSRSRCASVKDMIEGGGGFCPTASLFFKTDLLTQEFYEFSNSSDSGDFPLQLYLTARGVVFYIAKEMSVYRKGSGDASWSVSFLKLASYEARLASYKRHYAILPKGQSFFNGKYSDFFYNYKIQYFIITVLYSSKGKFRNLLEEFSPYLGDITTYDSLRIKLFDKFYIFVWINKNIRSVKKRMTQILYRNIARIRL